VAGTRRGRGLLGRGPTGSGPLARQDTSAGPCLQRRRRRPTSAGPGPGSGGAAARGALDAGGELRQWRLAARWHQHGRAWRLLPPRSWLGARARQLRPPRRGRRPQARQPRRLPSHGDLARRPQAPLQADRRVGRMPEPGYQRGAASSLEDEQYKLIRTAYLY
jgi:hypothetical protein